MMTMIMSLQEFFKLKASECGYTEELEYALEKWSSRSNSGINWGTVEVQIVTQAAKLMATPEKYIDYLFEAKSASEFISRLEEQKLAA